MRVFVLGAGASHHAGYPLAAGMGNCLAAWVRTLPSDHKYHSCLKQINDRYGDLGDFENILADLMTSSSGNLLIDLKEAIRDHFDAIRSQPALDYDRLTRVLRPGDSVITFNYDLGIERALRAAGLWDIETGYGFPMMGAAVPSPVSTVEVLKLHGSTNWRALLRGGMTGHFAANGPLLGNRPVLFFRPDLDYLGYHDFIDPLCSGLDTAVSLPAMILPALPKTFHFATTFGQEWKPFWDGLWQRAERVLQVADEVVIIGYSMPKVDERARTVILGAGDKNVRLSICCGNDTATVEKEFRDFGFSGIQSAATTFGGFLDARKPATETGVHRTVGPGRENRAIHSAFITKPARTITARLEADDRVLYSVEGTRVESRIPMDQLRTQLFCNGASAENIERFVATLLASGFAELRQPKFTSKFVSRGESRLIPKDIQAIRNDPSA